MSAGGQTYSYTPRNFHFCPKSRSWRQFLTFLTKSQKRLHVTAPRPREGRARAKTRKHARICTHICTHIHVHAPIYAPTWSPGYTCPSTTRSAVRLQHDRLCRSCPTGHGAHFRNFQVRKFPNTGAGHTGIRRQITGLHSDVLTFERTYRR